MGLRLHVQSQHILGAAGSQEGLLSLVLFDYLLNGLLKSLGFHHFVLDICHFQVFLCFHRNFWCQAFEVFVHGQDIVVIFLEVEKGEFEEEKTAYCISNWGVAQSAGAYIEFQKSEILFKLFFYFRFFIQRWSIQQKLLIFEQSLKFLEIILIEDDCSMTISFKVDSNIVVLSFFMKIFDSSSGKDGIHIEGGFKIVRWWIVGVVGLDKSNWGFGWNVEQNQASFVQFISFFPQFRRSSVEELCQNCSLSVSVNEVELSLLFGAE